MRRRWSARSRRWPPSDSSEDTAIGQPKPIPQAVREEERLVLTSLRPRVLAWGPRNARQVFVSERARERPTGGPARVGADGQTPL